MNWFKNIFHRSEPGESPGWRTDNSILQFIASHIGDDGKLTRKGEDLPDEKKDEDKLRFAPGLMDNMFGADDSEKAKDRIRHLSALLKQVANGNKLAENDFYEKITEDKSVIGIIDEFIQSTNGLPVEPYLLPFAKDLTRRSRHRNAVKFGIAITGLCGDKSIIPDLKILAIHDEFTIFSTIAIINLSDDIVQELWQLAKKVDGWGRIRLVDVLTTMELPDEVKNWLVREGYSNSIMNEYLAHACAKHGQLHEKLLAENIDQPLYKAAGEIIQALISDGPGEDISCYANASTTIEQYIRHSKQHAIDISDVLILENIKEMLILLQDGTEGYADENWTQDLISNSLIELVEVLNSKDLHAMTLNGLKSEDDNIYWDAKQVAKRLDIDPWDFVWQRLHEQPVSSSAWYDVTHHAKPEHADMVIAFALKNIPFNELATGPKDSMCTGPNYDKYESLDYAIRFLENYPGKGTPIILAGLDSPATRNRNSCVRVLSAWKQENWTPEIEDRLQRLRHIEPNESTKEDLEKLLNGMELT